jgi:hypothetical protein
MPIAGAAEMKIVPLAAALLMLAACQQRPVAQEATVSTDLSGNPDMSLITAAVDTDKDGRMTRAEWTAQSLPESSFNGFEKGRGYVTQLDYEATAAPPGIDGNGDGKLTVEEFKAFDAKMSAQMKDGKAPPPPAAAE